MRKHTHSMLVVGVGAVTFACGANPRGEEAVGNAECAPQDVNLTATSDAATLAGLYDITLVATSGADSGATVSGRVSLAAHAPEMQEVVVAGNVDPNARNPLYGTADVELETVGALRLGALDSDDPTQPGVTVVQTNGDPVSITLRLGSEANTRGLTRFDGGYTVLRVRAIDDGAFFGSWASGTMGPAASGYFCAVHAAD